MAKENNYIVILAGGGGTRLWPKSRIRSPKQFLKLLNDKTLFQETFDRAKSSVLVSNIYVVTGQELVSEIKREAPEIPTKNIIVEPAPKNTAPAIGLAAALILKKDKNAVISTLAADHYIKEKTKFLKILSVAREAVEGGDFLVTIGIKPTYAHTGFGYIHAGTEAKRIGKHPVFKVKGFKEKPDQQTAEAYFASGEYFWNANINTYRAKSLLDSIDKLFPQLSKVLEKAVKGVGRGKFSETWRKLPSEPIDTVILERATNVLMVPGDFSWHDVGDWSTLHNILPSLKNNNVIIGDQDSEFILIDTKNCLISSTDKLIATIGIKDLVIVDTPNALLVCSKSQSQEVKKIVQKLEVEKKDQYL